MSREQPSAIVIGAGMSGLLMAIRLRAAGFADVRVLEKAADIGGTWRENTYPGVACDVPSHAYTYSFAPNPDWSRHFPPGAEILGYFRRVWREYGIDRITRFGEEVTQCAFDANRGEWRVHTASGNDYRTDFVFCATGILHQPRLPDIPGRASFAGPAFHSARWDHGVALAGKRIGVIGNGSSATQIVSRLVEEPGTHVTVFQRTPQWIVSMKDRAFSASEKHRFRSQPWRMQRIRRLSAFVYAQGTAALTGSGPWSRLMHALTAWNGRRLLARSVRDPALRAKLTPAYAFGCKRVVISEHFHAAIQRPNAQLVTAPIRRIEPRGVVCAPDGGGEELHELDVLVMATGFDAAAFMRPMQVHGRGGRRLDAEWERKPAAYRSLLVPGFPNFFVLVGPNSPIGNQSIIEIAERQAAYIETLLARWRAGGLDRIEATPDALARWQAAIRARMPHTVWTSGCSSWYLDADGDALTWPDTWAAWLRMMAAPAWDDLCAPGA